MVLFLFLSIGCTHHKQSVNKFSDPTFSIISDFQDRRLSDSLYAYFNSPTSAYRQAAVLAFASIQDTLAITRLNKILRNDTSVAVRQSAAFAIGQDGGKTSESLLLLAIENEKSSVVMHELLEAYGKIVTAWEVKIKNQLPFTDQAVASAFYRAGLNGLSDSMMNKNAAEYLQPSFDEATRLAAANYFARGAKGFDVHKKSILHCALHDSSAEVRMATTSALRKIKYDSIQLALQHILKTDLDYRVRVNAARALQNFAFNKTKQGLIEALYDENINVTIAAAEVIKSVLTIDNQDSIITHAQRTTHWRAQAILYEAALSVSDDKVLLDLVKQKIDSTSNPYQKAALILALQQSIKSFEFVQGQLFKTDTSIVRSSAASAIVTMNYRKNFEPSMKPLFAEFYKKAMALGDAAVIGTIATALADTTLNFKLIIKDFSFLYEAKKKLSLPKDIEALQPLEAAIAYFEVHKNLLPVKNDFNHAINWKLAMAIPQDQQVIIYTTKGEITMQLFVEEAPGSVVNFVALINQHYFDNKFFHRVVPNFVVQAGCNRGDGWGSEDYSIRSEFTQRRYKTGSVGMASAGKDTEGTQWFITHSPTPHLDGRYTIFAEVIKGMEVVHRLEVGDLIRSVKLVK